MMKRKNFFWLAASALLLLLSACAGTDPNAQTGTNDSTPVASNAGQQVTQAFTTMQQLAGIHFKISGSSDTSVGTTDITVASTKITFSGSGVKQLTPSRSRANLVVGFSITGDSLEYTQIATEQNTYLQSTTNEQWFMLDNTSAQSTNNFLVPGIDPDFASFVGLVKKADISDLGTAEVVGVSVQHVRLSLRTDAYTDFLKATHQEQFSGTPVILPKIDVWFKPDTHQIYRLQLQYSVTFSIQQQLASAAFDTTLNYSQFNEPVAITIPDKATKVDSVLNIFDK
jgi:hypothetical protein